MGANATSRTSHDLQPQYTRPLFTIRAIYFRRGVEDGYPRQLMPIGLCRQHLDDLQY